MSAIIQYDFFKPKPTETELLKLDIEAVGESANKVRKGTYAAIGDLKKRMLDLETRMQILEAHLCRKD
jgi:hypothetical protein